MNFSRLRFILFAALISMVLHTTEEYITKLWNVDSFIVGFSNYFQINAMGVYLAIQFLVLLLILILLIQAINNKFNKILSIVLGLVFLLELLHPYNSLRLWGYYPGLYTGIILVIIGYFYWKELVINLRLDSAK